MRRSAASLVTREITIKTKLRYHFLLTRTAIIKKSGIGEVPATLLLDIEPRKMNTYVYTKTWTHMFLATLFLIAKGGNQPKVHQKTN